MEDGINLEKVYKWFEGHMNDDFSTPRVVILIDKLIKDL